MSVSTLLVWSTSTWTEITTLTGHAGRILHVGFSPDCRFVVSSATDSLIKLWSPDLDMRLKQKQLAHERVVSAFDFTRDGTLYSLGDNTIVGWDSSTREKMWSIPVQNSTNFFSISADGQFLSFGAGDFKIHVYNIVTKQEVYSLGNYFTVCFAYLSSCAHENNYSPTFL